MQEIEHIFKNLRKHEGEIFYTIKEKRPFKYRMHKKDAIMVKEHFYINKTHFEKLLFPSLPKSVKHARERGVPGASYALALLNDERILPRKINKKHHPKPSISGGIFERAGKFEAFARRVLENKYGVYLLPGKPKFSAKIFDFVSEDEEIIGDAKYFTMVRGKNTPPAKYSVIAEHVWLLEKLPAKEKFLVFGNDRRVPETWLEKYGHLVDGIKFYFIDEDGELSLLYDGKNRRKSTT
ncbi:hypothetical protein [Thermopetrobacter sp. TC1]|uniref:hypothetical protein n=1 Tax=Thermopetrobacter sp. TC1 TaxID=1495045 RepID=UPI0012DFED5E|nr:hypothetical protein [Thermopetrobacter sp. TC1]